MKTINIKEGLKEYFFLRPTIKIRVRQLERETSIPLPSVIRYCDELKRDNFLKTEIIGNVKFYSADRISSNFILQKKLYNIKSLSTLIEYLKNELSNPPIIMFGSYSKGEDTEDSDIDLYIETPIKNVQIPEKFEKTLKRKIHVFKHININKVENKNLANNILNGITLNGFVEVF